MTVAQYAELLRHSPWAQDTSFHDILQHAVRLTETLGGDPDVIEFASLVSRTAQISRR